MKHSGLRQAGENPPSVLLWARHTHGLGLGFLVCNTGPLSQHQWEGVSGIIHTKVLNMAPVLWFAFIINKVIIITIITFQAG